MKPGRRAAPEPHCATTGVRAVCPGREALS